jgi:AmmeMemoRadiSam system protein A
MPASSSTDPFGQLNSEDLTLLRALVWQVVREAVCKNDFVMPQIPESKVLNRQGACFVSLYVDEQLRGCTGSIEAHTALWQDVCKRTFTTTQDRRFPPIEEDELVDLSFKVNILTPLMPMENNGEQALLEELKPDIDGLLLSDNHRQAVFLPTVWSSLPEPKAFVDALKHKGGWPVDYWSNDIELYRFYTFEYES